MTHAQQLDKLKILLLNSTYEPLKFIRWKNAVANLFEEVAEPIELTHDGVTWEARGARTAMVIPSVIRLKKMAPLDRNRLAAFSPANMYLRDNYRCQLRFGPDKKASFWGCQGPNKGDLKKPGIKPTMDHVVPRYYGGITSWTNCVTACYACNQYKKHRLSLRPTRLPQAPTWLSIHVRKYLRPTHGTAEWKQWLK